MEADRTLADAKTRDAISKIQTLADTFLQKLEVPAAVAKEKQDTQSLASMQQMALQMQDLAASAIQGLQMANAPKTVDIVRDPVTQRPQQLVVQPQTVQ